LSTWSGARKIAEWPVLVGFALSLGEAARFLVGNENGIGSALSLLNVAVVGELLQGEAWERIRSLETKLSS
jgi:hypothetical protein